jgi:hypothetical protein
MVLVLLVAIAPATDAAKPRTTPPAEPTIRDAFDALVDLRAYRFRVDSRLPGGGVETTTTGTVLRRPVWRYAVETTRGGEVFWRQFGTSRGTLTSMHGSAFRRSDLPFDRRLPRVPVELITDVDLVSDIDLGGTPLSAGVPGPDEERDGRRVRRLTFAWPALTLQETSGFVGTGDLWLDASGGHVVESRIVGDIYRGHPDDPSPVDEHVVVTDIGSRDLRVRLPDLGPVEPATLPPGDAGADALIHSALDRLSGLTSYRIVSSPPMASIFPDVYADLRITVVNRPVPVALVEGGFRSQLALRLLVTEGSWWTAMGDGGWKEREGGFFWNVDPSPWCTGSPPCSFTTVTDIWSELRAIAPTFRIASEDELVDGVSATHLRSDVGRVDSTHGWIPGTWDVWIAREDGHLLRQSFDGQAIASSVTITGVDDPANALAIPADP